MIEYLIGSVIALLSLLLGYSLGKHQTAVPPDMNKKITQIFHKVVNNPDVGAVARPTDKDNFYRDNPEALREDQLMTETLKGLQK